MFMPVRFFFDSRLAFAFVLACLMAGSASPAISGDGPSKDVLTIVTIGTAPVNGDNSFSAEQTAISNALELAVEQGLTRALPSEILADNFGEILAAFHGGAETFILNYTTLAMVKSNDYCRVLVRTAVSVDDTKERVKQAGVMIDRQSSPRLVILLRQDRSGQPSAYWLQDDAANGINTVEKAMTENFTKRGITVLSHDRRAPGIDLLYGSEEPSDEEALEIGKGLGADFVVTGRSSVILSDSRTPDTGGEILGVLDARLLDANTGDIVFSISLQRHSDVIETFPAATSALAAAGREAARQFSPAIIHAFEKEKNRPQAFRIRIQGAGYLARLNAFRDILDAIEGVNRPRINEMKIDEAVMSVDFQGSSRQLARALAEKRSDFFKITVMDVLEDSIVVELTNADKAVD